MADIVINPSVGKIDFFTTKGDQSAANSLRLTGTTVLFAGPISASSISTGGGGAFVTSVQPTSNYLSKFTGNSTIANSLVYDNGTNVGIGTTSPADKLHVIGNIRINGGDILNWSGQAFIQTVGASDMFFRPNSTLQMILTAGGNLGIGNGFVNPLAKLHINSTTSGATLLRTDGTSGTLFSVVDDLSDSLMSVNNSAGLPVLEVFADDRIVGGQYGVNDFVVVNNKVGIGTNNPTAKLQVSGSTSTAAAAFLGGNVGIGTTSPAQLLELKKTTGSAIAILNYNDSVKFNINASSTGAGYVGMITNHPLIFVINDAEKVRVDTSGNVGIGTSSPAYILDIVGSSPKLRVKDTGTSYSTLEIESSNAGGFQFAIDNSTGTGFGGTAYAGTIYKQGAYPIAIWTNAVERMRITPYGDVGIGTTNPYAKLHVYNGSSHFEATSTGAAVISSGLYALQIAPLRDRITTAGSYYGGITFNHLLNFNGGTTYNGAPQAWIGTRLQDTTGSERDYLVFATKSGTGTSGTGNDIPVERMCIDRDGLVGIGTTSPAYKLDIIGPATSNGVTLRLSDAASLANSRHILLTRGSVSGSIGIAGSQVNDPLWISRSSGYDLIVDSSGNIGIGTPSPSTPLHVFNTAATLATFTRDLATDVGFSIGADSNGTVFSTAGAHAYQFYTNGTEKVRINNDGNVGIGTSSPGAKLQIGTQTYASAPDATYFVAGNDNFSGTGPVGAISGYPTTANKNQVTASIFDVVSGWEAVNGSHAILRVSAYNVINSTPALTVLCNGNVGIGTTSPAQKLHVVGNVLSSYNILTSVVKISSESDAASYISVDGYTAGLSYAGTYIGLASLVGYGVSANLYIGGGFPIIPTGWSGTISGIAYANATSLATSVLLQTSPDGSTWTTRSQTGAINGTETLTYSVSDSATPLYVRFTLQQSSGGSVSANNCNIQNIIITNLQSLPNKSSISNRFLVDGSGNVGIGTTIPAYKLEVNGTTFLRSNLNAGKTANINTTTAVNGTGGGNREFVTFTGASATGFTGTDNVDQGYGYFAATIVSGRSYEVSATMVVTNGTTLDWVTSTVLSSPTVPVQMIQLVPVSNTTYSFVATGDATYFGVGFNRTSGTMTAVVSNFSLKEVGSVLVTSNSNVGIGTTSPGNNLVVYNGSGWAGTDLNGTSGGELIFRTSGTLKANIYASTSTGFVLNGASETIFQIGSSEKMRIINDGNVGIGTSSPAVMLHVQKSQNSETTVIINNTNAGTAAAARLDLQSHASNYLTLQAYGQNFSGNVCGIAGAKLNTILDNALTAYSTGLLIGTTSTNPLYFATANAERMRIDSGGNVGIGTTTPFGTNANRTVLSVNGTTDVSLNIGSGGSQRAYLYGVSSYAELGTIGSLPLRFAPNNSEKMRLDVNGNLGIGTSSPTYKIDIEGVSGTSVIHNVRNPNGNWSQYALTRYQSDGKDTRYVDVGYFRGSGTEATRGFVISGISSNNLLTILESSGNVGIGTTVPAARLHLNSTTAAATLLRADGTSGTLFSVVDDLSDSLMSVNNSAGLPVLEVFADDRIVGGQYGQNDLVVVNNKVGIGTNNPLAKLHVTGSASVPAAVFMGGNVGIGTTNPQYKLHVEGSDITLNTENSYVEKILYFRYSNGARIQSDSYLAFYTAGTPTEKMRIDSGGNLLVGQSSITGANVDSFVYSKSGAYVSISHVSGTATGTGYIQFLYNNTQIGTILQSGTTAVTFNTTSDYRLKEDIQPLSSGLVRVNSLKPSIYKWKSDGSNGEGFIAHELAEVVPAAVTGEKDAVNKDGSINPQGVDMSKVVPILVAAIQELSAKVKTLEAKVQILESK